MRIAVPWRAIAPSHRPTGFDARDPASPGYSWTGLDATLEDAAAAHVTPILDVNRHSPVGVCQASDSGAARDAQGCRARGFRPCARHALRRDERTSGRARLPGLERAEPQPRPRPGQRERVPGDGQRRSPTPSTGSTASNLVVAGALDPFGHPKSKKQKWYSVSPLAFMRSLLCLSKGSHPHSTCHNAVHFDVWSHHPYTFGGAFGHASDPDDVELGDLPRMRVVLRAGVRLHHVVSAHPVKFWVTEFGWDSSPPRPHAAPMGLAARWTAESLYQMWLSGRVARHVVRPAGPEEPEPVPERSLLPLVVARAARGRSRCSRPSGSRSSPTCSGSTVSVWGRDATSTKERVTIQLRHGKSGSWRTVAYVVANGSGIFRATMKLRATKTRLAARGRAGLRQVARLLAHGAARSATSGPGATSPDRAASVLPR